MYRAKLYTTGLLLVLALQLWLAKTKSPLPLYFRYALYFAIFCDTTFTMVKALYRWNFVMLKGLSGPNSPSLLFGHMAMFYLSECDSLYSEWEKR